MAAREEGDDDVVTIPTAGFTGDAEDNAAVPAEVLAADDEAVEPQAEAAGEAEAAQPTTESQPSAEPEAEIKAEEGVGESEAVADGPAAELATEGDAAADGDVVPAETEPEAEAPAAVETEAATTPDSVPEATGDVEAEEVKSPSPAADPETQPEAALDHDTTEPDAAEAALLTESVAQEEPEVPAETDDTQAAATEVKPGEQASEAEAQAGAEAEAAEAETVPQVTYDTDGFPLVPQPHTAAWAVYLTRDVFAQLCDVTTPRGHGLLDCIRPGLAQSTAASGDGVRVPDADCYPMFAPYLDRVVAHLHGLDALPTASDSATHEPVAVAGDALPALPSGLASLVDSFAVDVARNVEGHVLEPALDTAARAALDAAVGAALGGAALRPLADASAEESKLLRLAEATPTAAQDDARLAACPASNNNSNTVLVLHQGEHVRALAAAPTLAAAWDTAYAALSSATADGSLAWQRQAQLGAIAAAPTRLGTGLLLTAEADLSYLRAAGRLQSAAAAAGLRVIGHGGALAMPPRLGRSAAEQAAVFVAALATVLAEESAAREDAGDDATPQAAALRSEAEAEATGTSSDGSDKAEATADGEPASNSNDSDTATGAADVTAMDPAYFYPTMGEAQAVAEGGLQPSALTLEHAFGAEAQRLTNVFALGEQVVLRTSGAVAVLWDRATGAQRHLRSASGCGIGALAVHPDGTFIAVADKGTAPVITIYDYPALRRYRVLRGGAARAYAHVAFDRHGHRLASVGAAPDYRLTVWDWRNEAVVLRTKAFSSDIWRVAFSNFAEGSLTTAGQGHIRFWQMANTFTGLKLQGQIGKFGRTELSDIAGFVEFPDGKVLSGTEWGNLLLWEGGFIKCEVARKGGKRCHVGAVETVVLLEEGDVATTGADGHVRIWDFEALDVADRPHDSPYFELEPLVERKLGAHVHVRSLALTAELGEEGTRTVYYAQDADGGLWRVDLAHAPTTRPPVKIETHHSGHVTGLGVSAVADVAATAGADGRVIVYAYSAGQVLSVWQGETPVPCSALLWPTDSAALGGDGRAFLVGSADGVVRLFQLASSHQLVMRQAFKSHACAVTHLALTPDGSLLAIAGNDASVFFCDYDTATGAFAPRAFVRLPAQARSLCWAADGTRLLVGGADGVAQDVVPPPPLDGAEATSRSTYEATLDVARSYAFVSIRDRLEPKKKAKAAPKAEGADGEGGEGQDEGQDEGNDKGGGEDDASDAASESSDSTAVAASERAAGMAFARYGTQPGTLLVAMLGADGGYLYDCSWDLHEPLMAHRLVTSISAERPQVQCSATTADGAHVLLGGTDGTVRVVASDNRTRALCVGIHDADAGGVTALAAAPDGRRILTAGADGCVLVHTLTVDSTVDTTLARPAAETVTAQLPPVPVEAGTDILDPQAYSIEEALQRAERDRLLQTAEERKLAERRLIKAMRKEFEALRAENAALPPNQRLPPAAFEMDPQMRTNAEVARAAEVARVRAELAWDLERHTLAHEKLRKHFKSCVTEPRIVVRALQRSAAVATFRVPSLSREFRRHSEALFAPAEELHNLHDRALRGAVRSASKLNEEEEEEDENDEQGGGAGSTAGGGGASRRGSVSGAGDGLSAESESASGAGSVLGNTLQGTLRLGGTTRARMEAEAAKTEERRARRREMRLRIDALLALKPDPNSMSDADMKLLKDMAANMGDYKLKTGEHYTVPVDERVNTRRKREQLIALRQRIHDAKHLFNRHVLTLRERKAQTRAKLETIRESLAEVQLQLGVDAVGTASLLPPVEPADAEEYPESRDAFTPETLRQFKVDYARQLAAERAAAAKAGGGGFGGFGGFGGGGGGGAATGTATAAPATAAPTGKAAGTGAVAETAVGATRADAADEARGGGSTRAALSRPDSAASRPLSTEGKDTTRAAKETAQEEEEEEEEEREEEEEGAASSTAPANEQRVRALSARLRIELEARRDFLLRAAAEVVRDFDDMVMRLLCAKRDTELRIKFAEYMHVLYYQELVHLKVFDIREGELEERRDKKAAELRTCQAQLSGAAGKLAQRKKDLARLQAEEKQLHAVFAATIGEGHPFSKFLTRMFRRKIKRRARAAATVSSGTADGAGNGPGEEDEDESESESEDSESSEEESGASDEEAFDDTVCPEGLDQALYERVLELRELRLDAEEAVAEEKRAAEVQRKESEAAGKRERGLLAAVEAAESEVEVFQLEKQARLNQLYVSVPLHMHQVYYATHGKLPEDMTQALIIAQANVDALKTRIEELTHEKGRRRREFKEIHSAQVTLKRELNEKKAESEALRARSQDMMRLKFGRVVDLENFESGAVNTRAEELKDEMAAFDVTCRQEISRLDESLLEARAALTQTLRANSGMLAQLADLSSDKRTLERNLDSAHRLVAGGSARGRGAGSSTRARGPQADAEAEEELAGLRRLAGLQQTQVAQLREQIARLSRKTGHVLPPSKHAAVEPLPPL